MPSLKLHKLGYNLKSFEDFRKKKLQGLLTGIEPIDTQTYGLQGIVIIQGETGTCKSTFGLQMVGNIARAGHPVLIYDFENGTNRIRMRLICQIEGISQVDVLCAEPSQLAKPLEIIEELQIYTFDEPINPDKLPEVVEYLTTLTGKPLLLFVDSLQALPSFPGLNTIDERINLQQWMGHFDKMKVKFEGKFYGLIISEKSRAGYGIAAKGSGKGTNSIEYKAEILLDLRPGESETIICQCLKFRDGLNNFAIVFKKELAEPDNPRSFTYKLKEVSEWENSSL